MSEKVLIEIPKALAEQLTDRPEIAPELVRLGLRQLRLQEALILYEQGVVSLAHAAELAEYTSRNKFPFCTRRLEVGRFRPAANGRPPATLFRRRERTAKAVHWREAPKGPEFTRPVQRRKGEVIFRRSLSFLCRRWFRRRGPREFNPNGQWTCLRKNLHEGDRRRWSVDGIEQIEFVGFIASPL